MRLRRVVSGGQTGVDRAALDAAVACGIPIGGWCHRGRIAEDGFVPHRYPLIETPSRKYPQRTMWNVRDSDGTLVLIAGPLEGGSAFTVRHAKALGRPHLIVDLKDNLYDAPHLALEFIAASRIAVLNVAGPRESSRPGIYGRTYQVLRRVFEDGDGSQMFILKGPPGGGSDAAVT